MISLNSLAELSDVKAGEQISVSALITDMKVLTTANGKDYVRLYLRDDKSATSVPLWNDTLESASNAYTVDEVYCITASTQDYQNKTVIQKLLSATKITDEIVIKRLKKHMFKYADKTCFATVLAAVKAQQSTPFGPYLAAVYCNGTEEDPKFKELCKAYASINHHDNYPGGFINHVGGMLRIAAFLKTQYLVGRCEEQWDVDWNYIFTAILLHDIGKLRTYTSITDYTIRFRDDCQLDHNTMGVGIWYEINESLPEDKRLPFDIHQRIAYTICFHDNPDKLYTHKHLEDKIISYIDGLEATLAVSCSLNLTGVQNT